MPKCTGRGCTNEARRTPYVEGLYCRPCVRALREPRESDAYLAEARKEASAARRRLAKRLAEQDAARRARQGLALKPPGLLPTMSPGWWEVNDRW